MSRSKHLWNPATAQAKLGQAMACLAAVGFGPRQSNEVAGYTLLALLDLKPDGAWATATNPLRGITPIIDFVATNYRQRYAPNTRETVRDEAVKHFVESGLVLRNPDNPGRPTNSGNTVYQVEPAALGLNNPITYQYGRFILLFVIDKSSGQIVDCAASTTLSLTNEFVRSIFMGKNMIADDKLIQDEFKQRFAGASRKAIIVAYRDAQKRYQLMLKGRYEEAGEFNIG